MFFGNLSSFLPLIITIIIIISTITVIFSSFFRHTRKTSFMTSEKKRTEVAETEGRGGEELFQAMLESKHSFSWEVFPYPSIHFESSLSYPTE